MSVIHKQQWTDQCGPALILLTNHKLFEMSDLAENIRLYGGSQVLEMVQSLDSPVWNVQQVFSFLTVYLAILYAANDLVGVNETDMAIQIC